ncbi:MAG: hypothetical protein PHE83_14085 [Opitutaceae bacterium]|nr:hypothetical protein [Opitutaceae bacterium]
MALLVWAFPLQAGEVLVLRDGLSGSSGGWCRPIAQALMAAGIDVQEIGAEGLPRRLEAEPGPGTILLLPNAPYFPAEAVPDLQRFLKRGNHLIAVSGPAFSRLMIQREGRWMETEESSAVAPVLESISPHYKLHVTHASALAIVGSEESFPFSGVIVGSIPRSQGFGCDALRKWRQIPLWYVLGPEGEKRVIAAELFLNSDADYAGSVWGYIGLSQADMERTSDWSVPLLVSMVRRIQRGLFLANAGTQHFAGATGERMPLGAYVVNLTRMPADLSVGFTVTAGARVVHSSTKALPPGAAAQTPPEFVPGESLTLPAGEYRVTTTLASGEAKVDEITYPFQVIQYGELKDDETVSAREGDFYLAGKKWYPLGINYWPRYILGAEPADYWEAQWNPEQYNPESVEADLALAEKLGLSMISIQYNHIGQAAPVMDLLARAHRHKLKAHIFLPGVHPLQQDFPLAQSLIRAAHLPESPAIFAYDLGWEVNAGQRKARAPADGEWQKWVVDQYGSIAAAEKDWGYIPARENGTLTGASDEQLMKDGSWRIYVAAYRRFWDDKISRSYREVRAMIRSVDRHHLLGARSGYGGTGAEWIADHLPFDLASGAKHLDFISPENYEVPRSRTEFLKSAFTTAYARLVSGGKPVYWAEYGRPVAWQVEPAAYRLEADPQALQTQGEYFRNLIWMVHEARANGCAGWWWPAGYRVDEKSDFGIVYPDLSLRPAAEEIAKAAQWFYEPLAPLQTSGCLVIDRDRHVTGYAGIYGVYSGQYAEDFANGKAPGIRTEGTGTDSANTPLVAVGDVPCNGSNPPKYLNAEFNFLRINGRNVRDGDVVEVEPDRPVVAEASVGNTAEARWLARSSADAGTVCLSARLGRKRILGRIESDTAFLHDACVPEFELAPRVELPVVVTFRVTAQERVDFGEVIRVTLQPASALANPPAEVHSQK